MLTSDSAPPPPPKHVKKVKKRKYRDVTPEEVIPKKIKTKHREPVPESVKEPKVSKEPKAAKEPKPSKEPKVPKEITIPKDKGKAPAKTASKTPVKDEPVAESPKEPPVKDKVEPVKSIPTDTPPLLRKPHEGEIEAGEIEGLITEEMARQHNLPPDLIGHIVEKRKGPGRPPKDGIMSKRQRSQLIKQGKEIARAKAAGLDPAEISMPMMKPKIVKRKDSNAALGEDGDIRETTEDGDTMGLNGLSRPSRPLRTPSPELRETDYTDEQLQRPTSNYVVLIHEAICSSSTGQMNLQQIYNYIEKKYPWYKFKTTTSGWQSSVRHNLGQHDAFVKGDKEGKGFNWKVNPEISIEKERRKRQVTPPTNQAQRQPYYPPNGYTPYPPQAYPYQPGMPPNSMPPTAPRLPPSLANAQPRLPPSMARDANATASTAPQSAPHPSPYASPWGGGNTAGSPSTQQPPRPYPPPSSQPPVSTGPAGGVMGVLTPHSVPQSYNGLPATASPYSTPYGTVGASPYPPGPRPPYPPYPAPGQQNVGSSGHQQSPAPSQSGMPSQSPAPQQSQAPLQSPYQSSQQPQSEDQARKDAEAEAFVMRLCPPNTNPDVIRQLRTFRRVYLSTMTGPGEELKVDNAIRAYVDPRFPPKNLNPGEKALFAAISGIHELSVLPLNVPVVKQDTLPVVASTTASADATGTHAAAAAQVAATSAVSQQTHSQPTPSSGQIPPASEPQRYTPNMTGTTPAAEPAQPMTHAPRPSVEPLTPVPGSPAIPHVTPVKRSFTEIPADAQAGAQGGPSKVVADDNTHAVKVDDEVPVKTD